MKLQHVLMAGGLLAGVWLAFFSDKTPDSDVAEAVVRPAAASGPAGAAPGASGKNGAAPLRAALSTTRNEGKSARLIPILALAPRATLISVGHTDLNGRKTAAVTTLFATQSWVPPPPVVVKPLHPPPPPPPVAPPLRLTYVGKKLEDGVWEVYLTRGETSYVVRNSSVIDQVYRVDGITPTVLNLTYLPLNLPQRLNIKGF